MVRLILFLIMLGICFLVPFQNKKCGHKLKYSDWEDSDTISRNHIHIWEYTPATKIELKKYRKVGECECGCEYTVMQVRQCDICDQEQKRWKTITPYKKTNTQKTKSREE